MFYLKEGIRASQQVSHVHKLKRNAMHINVYGKIAPKEGRGNKGVGKTGVVDTWDSHRRCFWPWVHNHSGNWALLIRPGPSGTGSDTMTSPCWSVCQRKPLVTWAGAVLWPLVTPSWMYCAMNLAFPTGQGLGRAGSRFSLFTALRPHLPVRWCHCQLVSLSVLHKWSMCGGMGGKRLIMLG